MKEIWIVYSDNGRAITAPNWETAICGWVAEWHITGDTTLIYDESVNKWQSFKEIYGDNWQSVLIALGDEEFNDLFDTQFYAEQIPYYEE